MTEADRKTAQRRRVEKARALEEEARPGAAVEDEADVGNRRDDVVHGEDGVVGGSVAHVEGQCEAAGRKSGFGKQTKRRRVGRTRLRRQKA